MKTMDSEIKDEVFVDEYTGGLVGRAWVSRRRSRTGDGFVVLFRRAAGDR